MITYFYFKNMDVISCHLEILSYILIRSIDRFYSNFTKSGGLLGLPESLMDGDSYPNLTDLRRNDSNNHMCMIFGDEPQQVGK